ncbi:MAG: bactofilin family protein [Candidatus Puniceispirillaceae bacterium]
MFERDKKNEAGEPVTSLIDADMRITGTVVSSGDIVLAGGVEGEIKCRNLYVEDAAILTGNVSADEAIVAGHLNGEVNVGTLRIKDTGNFDGVIKADGIEVENGAVVTARFRKKRR